MRIPSKLGAAGTGQPLREALAYHTPLQAVEIPAGNDPNEPYVFPGMNTGSWTLAAVTNPTAILTVAKPGSFDPRNLILRLYQATNTSQNAQVVLGGGRSASVKVVTAAEGEWVGPIMPIHSTSNGFGLTMNAAIATVQVDDMGLP